MLVVLFMTSPSSPKTVFVWISYCVFGLEVYRFVFYREVLPLPIWFYPPMLYYDVHLYIFVELVVTILTSPRSSKMESGCKRYARFRFDFSAVFSGAEVPALRDWPPEVPAQTPEVPTHISI